MKEENRLKRIEKEIKGLLKRINNLHKKKEKLEKPILLKKNKALIGNCYSIKQNNSITFHRIIKVTENSAYILVASEDADGHIFLLTQWTSVSLYHGTKGNLVSEKEFNQFFDELIEKTNQHRYNVSHDIAEQNIAG